jgi:hypothetical protein
MAILQCESAIIFVAVRFYQIFDDIAPFCAGVGAKKILKKVKNVLYKTNSSSLLTILAHIFIRLR